MIGYYERKEALRKVSRLNEELTKRFDLALDIKSRETVEFVREHYMAKREAILSKFSVAEALEREDYAKAVLLSEAAGLFLREIAPTRTKTRTRSSRKERK
jgi:hypothetical protein